MKSVFLSYSDRNVVLHIAEDNNNDSDLARLEKEFRAVFAFQDVSAIISFQRFDRDWDEYVELEQDERIADKSKLKVVVVEPPREFSKV